MTNPDLKKLLPAVEEIARNAGAEILKHYDGTISYIKKDGSDVTDADYASENIILPALQKLTPHTPILSEERAAAGDIPDLSKGTFWTVDPLDGTREFLNKTGAFVVAIGLIVDGQPVLGVIYHPAMGLLYSGCGPGTATKTGADGTRTALTATQSTAAAERILVNEAHANMAAIKSYLQQQFRQAAHKIDSKSSILRACQVADNLASMAVVYAAQRDGRTAFWDVAPGHAIVESAGGRVETPEGKALDYTAADLHVAPHIVLSPHHTATKNNTPKQPAA